MNPVRDEDLMFYTYIIKNKKNNIMYITNKNNVRKQRRFLSLMG